MIKLKNMPQVSIVLTSYGHGKYIREAIDSVLQQTFTDFELIIWDDASVDDSWEIIQSYNDPRIQAFQNPYNKGPVFGVNKAIFDIACGKYIAIHHSDDVWELDKLAKQVAFLEVNQNIGAVFSDAQPIDQRGMPLIDQTHFYYNIFSQPNRSRYEWLRHFFLKGNALCHPSILIRKQCYIDCGAYRDMLAQLPDLDMWIRLCAKYEIHVIETCLLKFRILDGEMNTSGNRPITRIRNTNEYYKLLQQYRTLVEKENVFKIFPDFISLYERGEDTDPEYVLSRVCLEYVDSSDSDWMLSLRQLLATEILFDILNDLTRRRVIKEIYGFSSRDFITITGENDLFFLNPVLERDKQINDLKQAIAKQEKTILAIENSLSWTVTRPFRRVFGSDSYLGIMGQRIIKLLWWTITLQLPSKFREWQLSKRNAEPSYFVQPQPPSDDYCFAVPFYYPIEKQTIKPSVAVVCHLYYPEILAEFKHYLSNIPFAFDLFITTDSEEKKKQIASDLSNWDKGAVEIRIAPNRGRDIAPKLLSCRDVYDQYEFFLHIHSKKSPHTDILAGWRHYLLETLLGSERIVESIFEAFEKDPKLGMIAPEHFHPLRDSIGWGWNFNAAKKFSDQLGIKLSLDRKIDFPSGSMFWGRSAAIKPLLDMHLTAEDFPTEDNQVDATLAHIIERLYFFICEKAGYRWVKIICPSLLRIIFVENKESLIESIKDTQYGLLTSNKDKSNLNI